MSADLIAQFTPESFSEWCRERFDRFTSDIHPAADAGEFAKAEIVGYVHSLPDAEANRPLLVMAVHAGREINERSSRRLQFDFARRQLQAAMDRPPAKVKGLFTQGLFAFYDDAGNFRLSLITGRAEGRRLVYSDFKRQSFFVALDRENKTFRTRMGAPFGAWKNLVEAFSVETLTKEFYNGLFAWYERAMDPASKVSFPNDLARDDDDRNLLSEHLIRLITRLMFVWFIRQKKLVPDRLFKPDELNTLLKAFDPVSPKQDRYYRAILQNLFFATLNCEIGEREFAIEKGGLANREHFGIKILYRYSEEFTCSKDDVIKLFQKVPFLNGGLFECLDKQTDYQDGFSRNVKRRAHIPNSLFFDDKGLITLFARYDFTVDENSPNDADVALDPELLGKVFENLLGAYNPETKQTARKQSGSFYTPREIVNYMVEESLVAHLRTKVAEADEPAIRALLSEEDPPALPDHLRRRLVEALYHGRILDPACGSGAFPMGILLKMVHLLQRLDPHNALWHEVVMAETEKALAEAEALSTAEKAERRRRITESFDQSVNAPDYARKLYLIENCIFGVDIQSIAVQIAKLRAFITLVCDQWPTSDPGKNYGMLPLPNLETKFVAANTLIGLATDFADGLKTAEGASLLNDPELHRLRADLAEVRHRHFRARNAPEKNKCRANDEKLRGKIRARLVEIASKPNAEKIALWQAEIGKLQQQRKEVEKEDWREVVRTTPTQGDMFEKAPKPVQTTLRMDVNKERRDRIDDDIRRLTRDIETEQNRARNKSAFQHEADRLAAWDPYDQNASSPFFDPEWMFDVKDGFDIVIGNPPYVRPHKMATDIKQQLWTQYRPVFQAKSDLYACFIQKSIELLRERGILSFIVSKTWLSLESFEELRKYILQQTRVRALSIPPEKTFDSATVETVIVLFERATQETRRVDNSLRLLRYDGQRFLFERDIAQGLFCDTHLHAFDLSLDPQVLEINRKVREDTTPLENCIRFVYGIKTGDDERFLDRAKRTAQHKKLLRRSDFSRYVTMWRGEYVWYVPDEMRRHRQTARPGERGRFESSKIIVQDIGKRIVATLDEDKYYVKDALLLLEAGAPLRYILGILNSRLMNYYYSKTFTTLSVAKNAILTLPIKNVEQTDGEAVEAMNRIVALVDRILSGKAADPAADTSAWEREIDEIVYRLYNLIPDEIAIVEGREPGAKKAPAVFKPAKAAAGAKKARKSVLTDDPDLA